MSIDKNLNVDPYFDDYDEAKKYYRILFKPSFAVQARELTQLQTNLQNQISKFGENIYQEGSVIKGCNFTELRNLKYIKLVDGINPEQYIPRTEEVSSTVTDSYYYEIRDSSGLNARIIQASRGFQTREPDLNTFFIQYINTSDTGKKEFEENDTLQIYEFVNRTQEVNGEFEEILIENGVVETTSVSTFSSPVGKSFGLKVSEGIIFQKGHFLFVDEQTVVLKKYISSEVSALNEPNAISAGFIVDEAIITSQQDLSLLDNSIGSPNENAPGADRLLLVPRLVSLTTAEAEADSSFFILRRYENGQAIETRDISQFNSISRELARRTYETHGDYTNKEFKFDITRNSVSNTVFVEMGTGAAYSKGYRISNDAKRFFEIDPVTSTDTIVNQPVNFEYGGYCNITSPSGTLPIDTFQTVDLLDSIDSVIGSAIVKNYTLDRVYLFNIRMDTGESFSDVNAIRNSTGNGKIDITPALKNSSKSKLVFPIDKPFVKSTDNISFSIRKSKVSPANGSGIVTIEPEVGEVFDQNSLRDIHVIDNTNTSVTSTTVVNGIVGGNLQLTVPVTSVNVTVFYNAKVQDAQPRVKQVFDVFVKTPYSDSKKKYTVGIPDAISIKSIIGDTGEDYTDSFVLNKNQKNNFYDHSFLEQKASSKKPVNGEVLTINLEVFKVDASSDYNFFTVDSYVNIDDDLISVVNLEDGSSINLKSSIDFRPYRIPIASYANTSGTATTIPVGTLVELPVYSTEMFDSGISHVVPSVNTSGELDIEFYSSRTDYIIASSYGVFRYIKGSEDTERELKKSKTNTIIAEIIIPGNPLLTPQEAKRLNKPNQAIRVRKNTTKTYTMKEIHDVVERIDRIEYYTVLSALERSADNLVIQDENGLNRFKNGIIADSFENLMIANAGNPDFNASVDKSEKILYPSVKQVPMNLRLKNTANTQTYDTQENLLTLSSGGLVSLINQKYASNFRSCTSNFYKFNGIGKLTPEYDVGYDTTTTPVNIDLDFSQSFVDFTDALSEFVPLTTTDSVVVNQEITNTTTDGPGWFETNTETTTTEIEDIITSLGVSNGGTNEQFVGDFVTSSQLQPFMRSRNVSIQVYGLRPETTHYFFFDGVNVDEHISRGVLVDDMSGSWSNNVNTGSSVETGRVRRRGQFGRSVKTNANGELFAVFRIPEQTFLVGERILQISDVNDIDSIASAGTSNATLKYNAYNFSVERTGLTVSTRTPEFDLSSSSTTRTVVDRTVSSAWRENSNGNESDNFDPDAADPIAQTFFIKEVMARGGEAVHVGRLDLYFKRKSKTNGCTVMIREVENGYPSSEILPFSKIHLRSSDVSVSEDGSAVTSVFFEAPVRLDVEKEYCFVVEPDAADPDYLIFTRKVGGTELITGEPLNSDWGDGVLFTSTNNRAWSSYQDEDIKFNLYRYDFSVNTGTAELETSDCEFFTLSDTIGRFIPGEKIYAIDSVPGTIQITVSDSSNIATGALLGSVYSVGDYLKIDDGAGTEDILKVVAISGDNTQITFDRYPSLNGSYQSTPLVTGNVTYFTDKRPDILYLEDSSSRVDRLFTANTTIYGESSGAEGIIGSIDNIELSYIQPMINRVTDPDTNVKLELKAIDPVTPENLPYVSSISFANRKDFISRGAIIYSKTNDISGEKNLKFILTLTTNNIDTVTPIVDLETAKIYSYIYNITNDSESTSRYISKKIELKEGFDSEDFRLYLTGYRPPSSDIKVYIKVKNETDPVSLENNEWIELSRIEGDSLVSNTSNRFDFKEFVYEIPESSKDEFGVTQYTNSSGLYSKFRSFAIKIDLLSESVSSVPKVKDYRGIAFE